MSYTANNSSSVSYILSDNNGAQWQGPDAELAACKVTYHQDPKASSEWVERFYRLVNFRYDDFPNAPYPPICPRKRGGKPCFVRYSTMTPLCQPCHDAVHEARTNCRERRAIWRRFRGQRLVVLEGQWYLAGRCQSTFCLSVRHGDTTTTRPPASHRIRYWDGRWVDRNLCTRCVDRVHNETAQRHTQGRHLVAQQLRAYRYRGLDEGTLRLAERLTINGGSQSGTLLLDYVTKRDDGFYRRRDEAVDHAIQGLREVCPGGDFSDIRRQVNEMWVEQEATRLRQEHALQA